MKTKNTLIMRWFLLCYIVVVLDACDCSYLNEYTVINDSSGKIKIELNSICGGDQIIIINQDSSKLICSEYTGPISCSGPYKGYFNRHIYKLEVYLNDTIIGNKDYEDIDNWNFKEDNELGKFTLTITDNDFERK
jgi:hypothetical protein